MRASPLSNYPIIPLSNYHINLRLSLTATCAINISGSKAAVVRSQLHVNRSQFYRLAGTAQSGIMPKIHQLLLRGAAAYL
jgi:hypothetical protein